MRTLLLGLITTAAVCIPCTARAQSTSVWLDAAGTHSRPPGTSAGSASSYGMFGGRVHVTQHGSAFEISGTGGIGSTAADGSWVSSRAWYDASDVRGVLDYGLRVEGTGLTYLSPVHLGGDAEYRQATGALSVQPRLGLSVGGVRLGAEATASGGAWRTDVSTPVAGGGPFPTVPGSGGQRSSTVTNGTTAVTGGALSALRVFGPASVTLRAATYHAKNQVADGRYAGVDGTLGLSVGPADLSIGLRRWIDPRDSAETGAHAGAGFALGKNAYAQGTLSRSVSDPASGARGSTGVTLGLSMRVGGRVGTHAAAAAVGSGTANTAGLPVTFTFRESNARTVAVAGDFSGWEPRMLTRGSKDSWMLVVALPPGVYHYSFLVDGTEWKVPDNADGIVDDGFGRKNATVIVSGSKGRT